MCQVVTLGMFRDLQQVLPGLDLVALVDVDVQFFHLLLAYPKYANITPVDEHYVRGHSYESHEPRWHQLRMEEVASHCTKQRYVEAAEVSTKQSPDWVGGLVDGLSIFAFAHMRVDLLCREGERDVGRLFP